MNEQNNRYMKVRLFLAALTALTLSACADLGFGLDVDQSSYNPYIYGTSGYYGQPWGNIGLNWDYPLYGPPVPSRPPLIVGQPSVRPPMTPPAQSQRPGNNGVPTLTPGGQQRPGNGGLPSVELPSTPSVDGNGSNNAHRGR